MYIVKTVFVRIKLAGILTSNFIILRDVFAVLILKV